MEFIPLFIKNTPLICSLTGVFLAIFWNSIWGYMKSLKKFCWFVVWFKKGNDEPLQTKSIVIIEIYRFLNHKWYFDFIYNYYIGYTILHHSYNSFYKLIDKGFIEILGSQGFSLIVWKLSTFVSRKQLGYIYHSGSLLVLSLFLLICLVLIF
jgi:hypothetical protein